MFYAKIWFKDSTFTKHLTFTSLYYRNQEGQVFNFSSITSASWASDHLVVGLQLVEPSNGVIIQVNMKIDPTSRLRAL